jgi:hypothetical protein
MHAEEKKIKQPLCGVCHVAAANNLFIVNVNAVYFSTTDVPERMNYSVFCQNFCWLDSNLGKIPE